MAEGMSLATASAVLSAVFQATSYSETAVWAQLHTDHPGADGTDNIAGNTIRMDASACFGTDPDDDGSGHAEIINDAIIGPWTAVSTSETYTHISFWSDETVGRFIGSGVITAAAVTAGDNWEIPVGDCTATLPIAA